MKKYYVQATLDGKKYRYTKKAVSLTRARNIAKRNREYDSESPYKGRTSYKVVEVKKRKKRNTNSLYSGLGQGWRNPFR